jgi:hypothetical protein
MSLLGKKRKHLPIRPIYGKKIWLTIAKLMMITSRARKKGSEA